MTADTITDDRTITINYNMSLEDMIAAGKYDWTNPNIRADEFPVEGAGTKKFRTRRFHFGRYTSSEDAVAAMKQEGFEPATHVHGLAYGVTFPDAQRVCPIACLGSFTHLFHNRYVVCLSGHDAARHLNLFYWVGGWVGVWRFLAVQEVSAT